MEGIVAFCMHPNDGIERGLVFMAMIASQVGIIAATGVNVASIVGVVAVLLVLAGILLAVARRQRPRK